jgi:UDP-glucose 4-epimerase
MKVIVVGSSGNLGSSLVRNFIKDGLEVTCFTRQDWIANNEYLFENVDVVIHAAANHSVSISNNISCYIESNLGITGYVLDRLKLFKINKLIFISSCAVYGGLMCPKESDPIGPVTLNGYMKAANEFLVGDYCSAYGIDYHILRIFNLYGGADRFSFVSKLLASVRSNTPLLVCNEGMSQRDYIHVDDVASIILKLVQSGFRSKYLNIGTGVTTKISEIVKVAKKFSSQLSVEYIEGPKEVEYIRADLCLLKKQIGVYDFKNVLDYIQECFS